MLEGLIGSAIGGISGFAGSLYSARQNTSQALQQMNYQTAMSNTSYTRAVRDLKRAGLNPMLAYTQGGASTPQGSMARMESTASDVREGARMGAIIQEQIRNLKEDTKKKRTEAGLNVEKGHVTDFQVKKLVEEVKLLKDQRKLVQNNAKAVNLENQLKGIDVEFFKENELLKNYPAIKSVIETILRGSR